MASCALTPQCRNKNGEVVDSKLWKDLYRLTDNNRSKAKELYKIATSDTFLSSVRDEAKYDMNGQITAHSFLKLSDMDSLLSKEADNLRRDFESRISNERLEGEINRFNNEDTSTDYVLNANRDGDNINLSVVKRNEDSTEELYNILNQNKLTELIGKRLESLGVAYDFVGTDSFNGRFSTINAKRMADGMYHLVQLSNSSVSPVEDLVEEAAHFAVAATKDKEATSRLVNAIRNMRKNGNLNSMFTQDEIDAASVNPKFADLELAGLAVKKAMMNMRVNGFSNLLSRVKEFIYNVFSRLTPEELNKDRFIADRYAQSLANGFVFNEDSFDVEKAVDHPMTLYSSKKDNANIKLVEGVSRRLSILNNKLMQASYDMAAQSDYLSLRPGELLGDHSEGDINESFASSVVAHAIDVVWDNFKKNFSVLKKIDSADFTVENTSKTDIDNLMQCIELFNSMRDICDMYRTFVSNVNTRYDSALRRDDPIADKLKPSEKLGETSRMIDDIYSELSDGKIANALLSYSRVMSASLMEFSFGRENITLPSRIVFNGLKMRVKDESTTDMLDLATEYIKDYSYAGNLMSSVSSFIRSKKFSKDALTQSMDKIARRARLNSSRVRAERLSELRDIQELIKKYNIDEKTFYERVPITPVVEVEDGWYTVNGKKITQVDALEGLPVLHDANGFWMLDDIETGIRIDYSNLTDSGYYISPVNRKKLAIDRSIAERRVKSQFLKELKESVELDEFKRLKKDQKYALFLKYRDNNDIWKNFITEAYDDYPNRIISQKYINNDFARLSADKNWLDVYNKLMEYKRTVDQQCLLERDNFDLTEENAKTSGRRRYVDFKRPQYRKSFIQRYKSHSLDKADLYNNEYTRFLCEDVTSDEFGDITTDNRLDDFNDSYSLYADGLRRLPISGVNDLNDMRELNDDLIGGMFAYTDMAYRFAGAQQIYSMMQVLDYTADSRDTGDFSQKNLNKLRSVGQRERDAIMNTYIYGDERNPSFWKKAMKVISNLGSLVSVRLLCVSLMSAMKNKLGGISVFLKDGLANTYGFTTTNLIKAWAEDTFNPKHWAGSIASKLLNKEMDWDKYQKLTERFDAYRNPRVRSTLDKRFNPISYLTNIAMSNYELTDTSMIAMIYRAYMKGRFVYDSDGNKISLEKTYDYDQNGNPMLKSGLLKDFRDKNYYKMLVAAKEALQDIIRNNNDEESTQTMFPSDKPAILDLNNFIADYMSIPEKSRPNVGIELTDKSGKLVRENEMLKRIDSEIHKITYNLDDEAKFINEVDDYIALSQGYYGMINSSEFQTSALTATFAKLKGWLFAFLQKNYMENVNMSSGKKMYGIMATQALAFATVFAPLEDERTNTVYNFKDNKMFRLQMFTAMTIPFALKNKKLRDKLIQGGWDPEQLNGLAFGAVAWLINLCLAAMAKILRRGNLRSMGNKMKSPESRREGKHNKYRKPGLLGDYQYFDEDAFDDAFKKWKSKGYPYSNAQKSRENIKNRITLDYPTSNYVDLPRTATPGDIYYVSDKGMHYKYYDSARRKGWLPYELGYYEPDSKEWNDHYEALRMASIRYDKEDPWYYLSGFAYKLMRGVTNEAMTLNDPVAMMQEAFSLPKAAIFSGGIQTLFQGVDTFLWGEEGSKKKFGIKEVNFWLKKFPVSLELDGSGKKIGTINLFDGAHNVCLHDYYESQDAADVYRDTNNSLGIPTEEQIVFRR